MTRSAVRYVFTAVLLMQLVPGASAHSLEETGEMIGQEERYFQPLNKPAPDFALHTADGKTIRLADFHSKIVVLHFIYTHCPDVCPLHAERIAQIQRMVKEGHMQDRVQFITITTDPTQDTSDVMRKYGKAHGLDPANWLFLTTAGDQPEDATRRLAEAFGHKFTKEKDGYQMHSIVTHVIDREGRWRANFHSLKFEPVNMVVFINALINDVHSGPKEEKRGLWGWLKALF